MYTYHVCVCVYGPASGTVYNMTLYPRHAPKATIKTCPP